MASQNPPLINTSYTFYISLVSQADTGVFQASPTLAAGDVRVAVDDAAPANIATLPTVDADFTKRVKVVLSASEMNGDNITIIFSDVSGAEWCDLTINLQTTTKQFEDIGSLDDDAITSAKFDGSTAFPLASVDSGATAVARVGADGDTLETLSDEIAALADITVADILAGTVEGSLTVQGVLRLMLSVLAGKASGGGTTSIAFRDIADTKNRVAATVDSSGNRSSVTLDAS